MTEHLDPTEIMEQITDLQTDIVVLRESREQMERNLADLDTQIDTHVTTLAELGQRLQAAIAAKTQKSVTG